MAGFKIRERHRKAAVLWLQGKTQEEIASTVGVSPQALRCWLNKAEFRALILSRREAIEEKALVSDINYFERELERARKDKSVGIKTINDMILVSDRLTGRKNQVEVTGKTEQTVTLQDLQNGERLSSQQILEKLLEEVKGKAENKDSGQG